MIIREIEPNEYPGSTLFSIDNLAYCYMVNIPQLYVSSYDPLCPGFYRWTYIDEDLIEQAVVVQACKIWHASFLNSVTLIEYLRAVLDVK